MWHQNDVEQRPERPPARCAGQRTTCHHCDTPGALHYYALAHGPRGARTRPVARYMPYCSPACFIRGAVRAEDA